ncbi:hypothetical protein CDL15_Pgr006620 [Punica granatum]|uniref:PB1-like domain-containing protein n=1 Tax=Punica granatum TaxID=22663 RepID=A0A218X7C9_PUNGR|nr:hypothetical protein CDL15_Pgr006620 [Punica granatum]
MDGDFRFVREPSGSTFRTVDVVIHHGGKFVRDPILRFEGGVVEVKKDEDIDKFIAAGVLDMLGNTYKTKPTVCFYKNQIFSDLDVGLEPLASDDDARWCK